MAKLFILLLVGTLAVAFVTRAVTRARSRRKSEVPELNQHPERLEQTLDETDDA